MASSLSEEEFHRMQLQLLELRTANYELESKCKKQERDIGILRETAENGDKELQKALKAINRSKKAKEVEILLQENDGLQLKLQSQEEDFRLQNQTLMQELSQLVDANEELEKRCKDTEQSRVGEVQVKPADTLHLEDEIRRLKAQNTALQRNISEEREKNDESDSDSIETLTKTIDDLKLNLDTEQEEKRILKEELASKEAKLTSECSSLKDELGKVTEKLKKKQESFLHLQEEKESLFKDTSAKYEELRASKDRDQKYYSDQITKLQAEIHRLEQNDANVASQQEVEKYQFQVNELRSRMVSLTQQRDDLDTQLQESKKASEEAIEQLRAITKDRDTQIQALQEADKVAEKRKKLLDDLAIKYQKDCDKNREDLLRMEDKYEEDLKVLRKKLEEEKRTSSEFEKQKQTLEDSQAQITSLEHSKSWLERRLAETEDTLKTTVDENKVTVDRLTSQHEDEVDRLKTTHTELTEDLTSSYEEKLKECKSQEESQQKTIVHLQEDNKRLQQEIKDGENDKKIHEKKGKSVLKDLKKQLHAERKRAEKLQDRLQQVLSENGRNTSIDDLFRASEMNDSWREDRSSVSSWSAGASGTGTYASFNTSTMSSSPQSPVIDSPTAQNGDTIEQENTELLSRLAGLQQEKWNLEEKVRHLETSTAAMADDLIEKSRIIEHYVMESRTDTKPHPIVHDEKISLKKVLDMVNKSDDQGLKDMNKKLQNMLEETLTKNMHLQKDLETLSEEIVRLSKLESVVVNKNSSEQLNKNSPDQTLCSSSDQSVSTITSLSSSDNVRPENTAISES